jgi:hypothetical protein
VPVDAEGTPLISGESRIGPARPQISPSNHADRTDTVMHTPFAIPLESKSIRLMILDAWSVLAYGSLATTISTDCGDGVLEQASERNAVVRGR